jgi:acetyltransferase-like isoleucine patch superfamily enzyme
LSGDSLLGKVRTIIQRRVGPRTFLKSLYICLKGGAFKNGKRLSNFMVNGNSLVHLEKNIRIINKGNFWLGRSFNTFPPTKAPCALQMFKNSTLIIHGSVATAQGVSITVNDNATLEIGNNVWINSGSKLICCKHIKIGDDSIVSWDVEIRDSDIHYLLKEDFIVSKEIDIGRNVWVGSRATILKGVKIGSGSIIATGAVVTKDVPENCLVAGVPGKVIKNNISWKR